MTEVIIDGDIYYPESRIVAALASVYPRHGVVIARLCDDHLDRSGRILGLVRDASLRTPLVTASPDRETVS